MKDFFVIFLALLALGYFSLFLGELGGVLFLVAVLAAVLALLVNIHFRLLAIEKKLDHPEEKPERTEAEE